MQIIDEGSADSEFDQVLEFVGNRGRYQSRILWLVLVPMNMFMALTAVQLIFLLTVPSHWCHVPGSELFGVNPEQWKNMTLPREVGPNGDIRFSQCKMKKLSPELKSFIDGYDVSTRHYVSEAEAVALDFSDRRKRFHEIMQRWTNSSNSNVGSCQYGWEYDQKYYKRTIPTDYNWVCDKDNYSTNVFTFAGLGSLVGTIFLAALSDRFGRRLLILITTVLVIFGRFFAILTPGIYPLFMLSCNLASLGFSLALSSPYTIATEICAKAYRARMYSDSFNAWVLGLVLLSFVSWLFRDWVFISLIATFPSLIVLILIWLFLPESPRWLLSRGRISEAEHILRKMARVNGREEFIPHDLTARLKLISKKREKEYGMSILLYEKRLLIRTIHISICWAANTIVYRALNLNLENMAGNPFLNFLYLGVVEVPGNIVGQMCSDRFGRRWTQTVFLMLTAVLCFVNAATLTDHKLAWLSLSLTISIKFTITVAFLVIFCQTNELYPTCIRQTGSSFSSTFANVVDMLGPYIVYLGHQHLSLPYIILGSVLALSSISASRLPETRGTSLPETLQDAVEFGHDTPLFCESGSMCGLFSSQEAPLKVKSNNNVRYELLKNDPI